MLQTTVPGSACCPLLSCNILLQVQSTFRSRKSDVIEKNGQEHCVQRWKGSLEWPLKMRNTRFFFFFFCIVLLDLNDSSQHYLAGVGNEVLNEVDP